MTSAANERSTRTCAMAPTGEKSRSAVRAATKRMRVMPLAYSTSEPESTVVSLMNECLLIDTRKSSAPSQALHPTVGAVHKAAKLGRCADQNSRTPCEPALNVIASKNLEKRVSGLTITKVHQVLEF